MADDGWGAVTGGKRPAGVGVDETAAPAPWAARVSSSLVFRWVSTGTLGVLVALLARYGIYVVRGVLVLVVVAVFVAVSLEPVVRWLMRRGMRRAPVLAAVVALAGAFLWSAQPGGRALMAISIAATVKVAMSSPRGTGHRGSRATASADTPRREPAGDRVTGGR